MNQPYARVNQPYATLTLASALREMFGVQLYKNNARALLSRILSILNLDWLQHARSVRGVYECKMKDDMQWLNQTFQNEGWGAQFIFFTAYLMAFLYNYMTYAIKKQMKIYILEVNV